MEKGLQLCIFIDIHFLLMTKIISFISRKGGTGKTTSAIHFATMLHSLGHKLMMLETDTNYTLNTLRKMELYKTGAKESAVFPIIGSEDHRVLEDIEQIKANMEHEGFGYEYLNGKPDFLALLV